MADSLFVGQVDGCDLVSCEEDAVMAIGAEWADGEAFAPEGLRDLPQPALGADIGFGGGDGTHDLLLVVIDCREAVGHGARTWPVAARRHVLAERFMRTIEVVDGAPAIECALYVGEIAEALEGEHLGLERAIEALVLAAALRVIGPAVDHGDAELEQPDAKPSPRLCGGEAPRPAVIDIYRFGQPVAAERALQMSFDGPALLIGASCQAEREARVIIDHGERVTGGAIADRHVALEVHLPKQVGRFLFEPQVSLPGRAGRRHHAPVPVQDRMQSAGTSCPARERQRAILRAPHTG